MERRSSKRRATIRKIPIPKNRNRNKKNYLLIKTILILFKITQKNIKKKINRNKKIKCSFRKD